MEHILAVYITLNLVELLIKVHLLLLKVSMHAYVVYHLATYVCMVNYCL